MRGPCLTYQYQTTKILITYSLLVVSLMWFQSLRHNIGSMHSVYGQEYFLGCRLIYLMPVGPFVQIMVIWRCMASKLMQL